MYAAYFSEYLAYSLFIDSVFYVWRSSSGRYENKKNPAGDLLTKRKRKQCLREQASEYFVYIIVPVSSAKITDF